MAHLFRASGGVFRLFESVVGERAGPQGAVLEGGPEPVRNVVAQGLVRGDKERGRPATHLPKRRMAADQAWGESCPISLASMVRGRAGDSAKSARGAPDLGIFDRRAEASQNIAGGVSRLWK
jgi:hypothetical protein